MPQGTGGVLAVRASTGKGAGGGVEGRLFGGVLGLFTTCLSILVIGRDVTDGAETAPPTSREPEDLASEEEAGFAGIFFAAISLSISS